VITGFNTDIKHNEKVYHIQTEDKGMANPYIESLVYVGGEILASKKTSYAEKITEGLTEAAIAQMMEHQHRTMIAAIKRGKFDSLIVSGGKKPSFGGAPPPPPSSKTVLATPVPPAPSETEKSLDQVILDFLAQEAEEEHLELSILSPCDFVSGSPVEMRIAARKSLSQLAVSAAAIEVKMISTVEPPRVLFRGATGQDGTLQLRFTVPQFNEGTAAVIISAHSDIGNDEVKQLVKRRK
jgi:hypothetical protein